MCCEWLVHCVLVLCKYQSRMKRSHYLFCLAGCVVNALCFYVEHRRPTNGRHRCPGVCAHSGGRAAPVPAADGHPNVRDGGGDGPPLPGPTTRPSSASGADLPASPSCPPRSPLPPSGAPHAPGARAAVLRAPGVHPHLGRGTEVPGRLHPKPHRRGVPPESCASSLSSPWPSPQCQPLLL